ncbi:hypothetical protein [Bosea sp. BK604]|uniref:hypothetical protein n=1 Tax=Bosea sp. BK604 TaxID=2512180 RepID=UPI00104EF354|nr:hypothetical protein [Bosea sp. BK604]TCR65433.1 hypothetical protein EV560_105196 [Bosea sp. BK604]
MNVTFRLKGTPTFKFRYTPGLKGDKGDTGDVTPAALQALADAEAAAAAALASQTVAAGSATAAAGYASSASGSASAATTSAGNAATSETNAAASAASAEDSAEEAANLIGGTVTQAVRWDVAQSLSGAEQQQARDNIAALSSANNAVANANLRDSAGLSVIGRSANSPGDPADIAAGTDGFVLRRSGTTLGFGTTDTAGITNDAVTNAKLANVATQTIKGRTAAGTGDPEDLTATQAAAVIGAVRYSASQLLSASEAAQARTNVVAASKNDRLRDRLINGGMQCSIENGSTAVDVTNGVAYPVDQWLIAAASTPGGILRGQRVASITPQGNTYRLRASVQAADTSIAAGDIYLIQQPIEGIEISDALFGTVAANSILLRIGVRANLAGLYGVALRNNGLNRSWTGTFEILSGQVNTDLSFTFTIPGDTSGTWIMGNVVGMYVSVALAVGSTFHGGGGWQSGSFVTLATQVNFMASTSNTFELFDCSLHVDQDNLGIFPTYEMPDEIAELVRCKRYACFTEVGLQVPAIGSLLARIPFPVEMRAAPTTTVTTTGTATNASVATEAGNVTARGTTFQVTATAANGFVADRVRFHNARM